MTVRTLDLDTLRTLVAAHDMGGFGPAGIKRGRSASAISLQMKRLQLDAGAPLFRRDGRGVALTETGEIVLRYARRMLALNDELLDTLAGATEAGQVRLGVSQDFAGRLPPVLSGFAALFPKVVVEVRIEGNAALADAVEAGALDLALTVGQEGRRLARRIGGLNLTWIAAEGFRPDAGQPLPLLLLGPQCAFRKAAVAALDEAGLPWRLAASSPSLAGLWATALGGLGVTARAAVDLPAGLVTGEALFGLPRLPAFAVTLQAREGLTGAAARLGELLEDAVVLDQKL